MGTPFGCAMNKSEQEIRNTFVDLDQRLRSNGVQFEVLDAILAFPTEPVDPRRSGRPASEAPEDFQDMTFSEFVAAQSSTEDPRPAWEVFLEKTKPLVELAEFGTLLKNNDLIG